MTCTVLKGVSDKVGDEVFFTKREQEMRKTATPGSIHETRLTASEQTKHSTRGK
jgi:hypothetical protein